MNDDGSHDELYPIDQVDWNIEQTRFKQVMREVVYHTHGICFDGVRDTEDSQAVVCQLWTQAAGDTGEWMRWYSIDKVSLRNVNPERLIADAIEHCTDMRDGKDDYAGKTITGTPPL
jgi:hypothetical protein